jgi:hypothetical protein
VSDQSIIGATENLWSRYDITGLIGLHIDDMCGDGKAPVAPNADMLESRARSSHSTARLPGRFRSRFTTE